MKAYTNREKMFLILSVLVAVCLWLYVFDCWSELPTKVPMHFGASGAVDSWGPRGLVLLLPSMYVGILALGFVIRRFPHMVNLPFKVSEKSKPRAVAISLEMVSLLNLQVGIMFGYITFGMVRTSHDPTCGLGAWFLPVVLIVLTASVGFYLVMLKKLEN
jgi:hypothetical protein